MSYEQTLWKEVKDIVNPKILSKQNRLKKWEYGYNSDYDFIVISKTGQIGQIIEIQNLRIALPAIDEPFKRSEKQEEQYWERQDYPKELAKIKTRFDWEEYPSEHMKNNQNRIKPRTQLVTKKSKWSEEIECSTRPAECISNPSLREQWTN